MSTVSQPSSKQITWIILGIILVVALVLVLGSTYGYLIKTQANIPQGQQGQFDIKGNLKTQGLDSGAYTLKFTAKNSAGASTGTSVSFKVLGSPLPY